MMTNSRRVLLGLAMAATVFGGCAPSAQSGSPDAAEVRAKLAAIPADKPVKLTDAEWHAVLPSFPFKVLREAGTEPPFANKYWNLHDKGDFVCAGCGQKLFSSETKFDSGTGWPSFFKPVSEKAVVVGADNSLGMTRDEVRCSRCDGHLGHVFDDGPKPTGLRYCINSASLEFRKAE